MKRASSLLLLLLLGWAIGLIPALAIPTPAAALATPPGFYPVEEKPGATLFRKDYPNGTPDLVLVADLSAGASIDLLYGHENNKKSGTRNQGMFAGPNPSFTMNTISGYWQNYAETKPGAFCVTNGQFFYMPQNPSPLALPLKAGGNVLAEGFGYPQYPEKQLMLELWPDHADIQPLTRESLYGTSAPDVIGGLTEEANKKPKNSVGRTFLGIIDGNGDGVFETLAILTTSTSTQAGAAKVLYDFGAARVMMLDGGGSTQLVCGGRSIIDTGRALPQALGVAAAGSAPSGDNSAVGQAAFQLAQAPASTPLPPTPVPATPVPVETAIVLPAPPVSIVEEPTTTSQEPKDPSLPVTDLANPTASGEALPYPSPTASLPADSSTSLSNGSASREQAAIGQNITSENSLLAGPPGQATLASGGGQNLALLQAGPPPSVNLEDVLLLPVVMSPISAIVLLAVRRRMRTFE